MLSGKPEQQVRKVSHRGGKQQQRSCGTVTLLLLVHTTYILVLFFALHALPFMVNSTFMNVILPYTHHEVATRG